MPPVGFEPTITASEWPQIDSFYLRSHWDRYVVILTYILLLQVNYTTISEPNSRKRMPVALMVQLVTTDGKNISF